MPPADDTMKPPPSLPSPTLTNPDMVLPDDPRKFSALSSPPRNARRARPPSPSYLRHRANDLPASNGGDPALAGPREKRGLMSRKMLLLRSRTASNIGDEHQHGGSAKEEHAFSHLHGSRARNEPESKWSNDESSAESEDLSGLPQLLAKYRQANASGTDDELDGSTAVDPHPYAASTLEGSSDAERLQKERDEQHSAILSKRAEQILANAKKRLNLMEGNLRGARDLVAPLTAANLKRATSLASYVPPINNYGGISRYVEGGYRYDTTTHQSYRALRAQASNPVIGQTYQGHSRGFSETRMLERPSTALERAASPIVAQGLIPTKAADPTWTKTLKGSRSHDSLAIMSLRNPAARDQHRGKGSPDSNLGPLLEDEGPTGIDPGSTSSRTNSRTESHHGSSIPEDLHEQMSSLRGRISALKERAREDSLRRRSAQNMREPSPLNNAVSTAPELFYSSSPTLNDNGANAQAHREYAAPLRDDDPASPTQSIGTAAPTLTGSRNAFAEQARRQLERQNSIGSGSASTGFKSEPKKDIRPRTAHRRTPSGTAVVQSSKHRYSHHQTRRDLDVQGTYATVGPVHEEQPDAIGTAHDGSSGYGDDEESEVEAIVDEDASPEDLPPVVAHEDREDAFDYENFFLHSAMSYYGDSARPRSTSSTMSTDSVSTARGPATAKVLKNYSGFDSDSDTYIPPAPQTPQELKRIEKNLHHHRSFSEESLASMTSFATANEGRETPDPSSALSSAISSARVSTAMQFPVPPSENLSRPGTARMVPVKPRQIDIARSDSSSDRADSGLGLSGIPDPLRRPAQVITGPAATNAMHKPSLSSGTTLPASSLLTPPNSPAAATQNPASVAVNALLLPNGRRLGLRDKALMFGLVESLKTLCHQLQEGEETGHENRMLRRRLDDARRVLAGGSEIRPGTS